jgi:hypothetical protein
MGLKERSKFDVCKPFNIKPTIVISTSKVGIFFELFLIGFFSLLITVIFIYVYRKYVQKNLEQSLKERIEKETIYSLGQYRAFQDTQIIKKPDESTIFSSESTR